MRLDATLQRLRANGIIPYTVLIENQYIGTRYTVVIEPVIL
jgi:hypothetical protein